MRNARTRIATVAEAIGDRSARYHLDGGDLGSSNPPARGSHANSSWLLAICTEFSQQQFTSYPRKNTEAQNKN